MKTSRAIIFTFGRLFTRSLILFWYFWLTIQNTANGQVRNLFGLKAVFISFCRWFAAAAAADFCCCCCAPHPSWGRECTKKKKVVEVKEASFPRSSTTLSPPYLGKTAEKSYDGYCIQVKLLLVGTSSKAHPSFSGAERRLLFKVHY